jgi:hypothetical protein
MRYRFLMSLFGMSLDKRKFAADFGVSIERGLPLELAFMRSSGAFAIDNAEQIVLTERGRYLLVVMMREFFISVNNLRDQARGAISGEERLLLFGDGDTCSASHERHPLAAAAAATETAETTPMGTRR